MYSLGFFSVEWDHTIALDLIQGINWFLQGTPDARVWVLSGAGNFNRIADADLLLYDAIVIQGNHDWATADRQRLADQALALGIPVVSINYPLRGCSYVGTDNRGAMHDLASHLMEAHGAQSFIFVKGPETSQEARDRLAGFEAACQEHNILADHVTVMEGSWHEETGATVAEDILDHVHDLPDAIMCSNDRVAVGLATVLQQDGVSIPQDVAVTGFDGLDMAASFRPQLATVDRDYATVAETSLALAYHTVLHHSAPQVMYSSYHVVPAGSCGCKHQGNPERLRGRYMELQHTFKHYFLAQSRSNVGMISARTMGELMDVLEAGVDDLSCDSIALVMSGQQLGHKGERMLMALAGLEADNLTCDEKTHCYLRFPITQALPSPLIESERLLLVYPLNTRTGPIGYIVVDNVTSIMELHYLQMISDLMGNRIAGVIQEQRVSELNERLSSLYAHDQLTGLYNRFGLEHQGSQLYQDLMGKGRDVAIAFADIDHMKTINDGYGHGAGDEALREVAEALQGLADQFGLFAMRYGGDEFLLIGDAAFAREMLGADALVASVNASRDPGFAVSVSVGVHIARAGDNLSLDEEIRQADKVMYRRKQHHHERR